jgi:hypothetical protein
VRTHVERAKMAVIDATERLSKGAPLRPESTRLNLASTYTGHLPAA